MISLTTLPEVEGPELLAATFNIQLETSALIFIGNHDDTYFNTIATSKHIKYTRSAHGPFFDLMPCTMDLEFKDLILRRFRKTIEWCKRLNIKNIVFHSGWFPKTYPHNTWLNNSVKFWNSVLETVNDDTSIFIENVYEDDPKTLKELIIEVNKSNFNVCIDLGHINANSNVKIVDWLEDFNNRIGHIHIHNNYGKNDDHNGVLKGTIQYPETFKLLKDYCPNAFWNLEIKNDIKESIQMALDNRQ